MLRVVPLVALAVLSSASTGLLAQKTEEGLSGDGELGVIINGGNTENENYNSRLGLVYRTDKWTHSLGLLANGTKEDEATTAERYQATQKSEYDLGEGDQTYLFSALRWDKDRFSGFDYQASVSLGIGFRVLNNDTQSLDLEFGPGYKISETNATAEQESETIEDAIARLGAFYSNQLTATTQFTQDVLVEIGDDNTVTESITGLQVSMTDALALKLSYTIRNNSDVPPGSDETDTIAAVTLVYGFE